jgi:putative membrane-bound dehydrogenase-like protein
VSAYANDVPCYIPSVRILQEGGYEAESSLWYYDRPARLAPESEELIIKAVHELLPRGFTVDPKKAEFPPPQSPAEALASFRTKADMDIELVASEPLIVDPVAIDFGPDGRLWVVEMHDYPAGIDGKYQAGGRVKVLTDSEGDGKYEGGTLFLDGLPFPTGVMAWKKGALICAAPDILYAEDTNGDGKADVVRTNFTGFATHNYQARVNGLTWGLDGWVYGASGLFGGKIKGFPSGKEVDLGGRDFRMKPDTGEIEPVAGLSQQSRVRDDWDNWFGCDNSTLIWHFPLPEQYVKRNPYVPAPEPRVYPVKDAEPNRLYPVSRTLERFNDPSHVNRTTSACGLEIYRDELLGTNYYGNAFICEPVHNLVHRLVLQPDGATFSARRAPDEQRNEFLASTDNWFRPVQARTGPDGALWIVDMYRFVIEHPRWIPTNRLATLDVRAGEDKGRIYRVYPRGQKPRPIRDLTKTPSMELLAAFDGPNGPTRDLIHREVLARKDVPSEKLSALATNGTHAAARGQALWILRERGQSEHLAIRDPDMNVRCQAIRLYDGPGLPLRASLIQIGRGPNPFSNRTAFEVALIAGNRREPYLADALVSIARQITDNRWLKAAVVSSAVPHIALLLEKLCGNEQLDEDLLQKLITTAVRAKNQEGVDWVLRRAIPGSDTRATERQFWMLRAVFDAQGGDEWSKRPELAAIFAQAREAAQNGSAAAIALLGRESEKLESDTALLVKLANEHPAALQRLRQVRAPSVAALVLKSWPAAPPGVRQKFVDLLVTREEWSKQLRAAIDQGVVATSEISLPVRQRLGLKTGTAETSRAEVLARYAKVAELPPAAARGSTIFGNNCASCHAFRNSGHAVGPNLAEFAGKPVEDFVAAIVDPNAALEPKFAAYEVEMRDGRSFHGVVRGETATSLTIAQANGVEEKVLRSDLKELKASTLSLMPEGLEQAMSPQDMADLIAWLKQGAPAPFGSASAEKAARAREAFGKEQSAMRVGFASEQSDYPSWLGRLPLAHCRQTDGKSRVTWEVNVNEPLEFRFAAGLGFISQPDGEFDLKVNGERALGFDVTLHDTNWQSADGKVRMSYAVMENNAEDSNGVLTIVLDASLAAAGKPIRFEVAGSASNSQRWFGLYRLDGAQVADHR